jgi:hypothetical protein
MHRFATTLACAMVGCVTTAYATTAGAQSLQGSLAQDAVSNFSRDRNISVRQRPRPEYDMGGHRSGAFMVSPTVTGAAEYNDNIYGTAVRKTDDVIFRVTPRVDAQSTWSRHLLAAFATATVNKYAEQSDEDTTDWSLGAQARLDMVRGSFFQAGADTAKLTEPRTSSNTALASAAPVRFQQTAAFLGVVHELNRLRLSARGDVRRFNYEDGRTAGGVVIDQDERDRATKSLNGRADYAVSPATAVFVQVTGNWRDYNNVPARALDRTSNGYELLAGANFELSNVMRGELGVGYLSQSFDDARFSKIDGFGMRGQLEWFPTQLTTLTATAARSVEDAGIAGASGYLSTNLGLQVDHELLRNIILTGQVSHGNDAYQGVDRTDKRLTLGASVSYMMNRRLAWTLGYSLFDQSSSGRAGGVDFKVNRLMLTLVGKL